MDLFRFQLIETTSHLSNFKFQFGPLEDVHLGITRIQRQNAVILANEGLACDPLLKNVKFLVVTIAGKGDNPNHTCFSEAVACSCCSCCCCCCCC